MITVDIASYEKRHKFCDLWKYILEAGLSDLPLVGDDTSELPTTVLQQLIGLVELLLLIAEADLVTFCSGGVSMCSEATLAVSLLVDTGVEFIIFASDR